MENLIFELSVILISTATLCFLAEITKQPFIVAYIFAGFLVGPHGLNLIHSSVFFFALSQIGIVLLLYLIGLELKPGKFLQSIKKNASIAILSALSFFPLGFGIGWVSGLGLTESLFLSIAFIFSSTVVVMKTLRDEGKVSEDVFNSCVAILLIQDIIAIITLIVINSLKNAVSPSLMGLIWIIISDVLFVASAFVIQRFVLRRIMRRIVGRTDLMFLMGLAWCFFFAEFAEILHLSREIGAFIAGLSLTNLPEKKLKIVVEKSETIRDFFMILFFFVLGANLKLGPLEDYTLVIALSLIAILVIKPLVFYLLARRATFAPEESREIGIRLGQNSEFSIIIATLAVTANQISDSFAMVIQLILFLSIIFSNYIVRYIPFRTKARKATTA